VITGREKGDGFRLALPAVIVHGPGSKIARLRREWVAGTTPEYGSATIAKNMQTVEMSATVPFDERMTGGSVIFESVEGGCCRYDPRGGVMLAGNILPLSGPVVASEPVQAPQPVPNSVADKLSVTVSFVFPIAEYNENEPFKKTGGERGNVSEIFFRTGRHDIDPYYMDNRQALATLESVIRSITASKDSRIERIVVGGFASPEGGTRINESLAYRRAVSLKRYIMNKTGVRNDRITVYNGLVDWQELRARIEADDYLYEKRAVLDIIDNTPVWDSRRQVGRLGQIMRLNGGATYRYLLREHFPYLRSGALIKVYYQNQ
jgi:outer membrane protein OmpA-like peptidoglycan-associated protein